MIDQSAVGTSTRSNPATYTGIMDDVRKAFAAANKVNAGLFSFNSKGACENCKGSGVIYTDLAFLDGVKTPCEVCDGRRFKDEVLAYKFNGKSISDVLALTVAAGARASSPSKPIVAQAAGDERRGPRLPDARPAAQHALRRRVPAHQAGQRAAQEGQHLRAGRADDRAAHVGHRATCSRSSNRLVDGGNTVIVIEHNMDVIRNADWIIDIGPEGGSKGGRVDLRGAAEGSARREAVADARLSSAGGNGDLSRR